MGVIGGAGQGPVEETPAVVVNAKGVPVKEQQKPSARLLAGIADTFAQADFQPDILRLVKLAVRPGASGAVQPPDFAIGEDAPLDAAAGGLPELFEVILDLPAGAAGAVAPVQVHLPGFRFRRRQRIAGEVPGDISGAGKSGPVGIVSEQHIIGRPTARRNRLLGQIAPAQGIQHGPDERILNLRFVGTAIAGDETAIRTRQILPEMRQPGPSDLLVLIRFRQAGLQIGLAEQGV